MQEKKLFHTFLVSSQLFKINQSVLRNKREEEIKIQIRSWCKLPDFH